MHIVPPELFVVPFVLTFITTRSCVNCFYASEGVISLRNLVHKSFINTFVRLYNLFQSGCFGFVKSPDWYISSGIG